MRNRSGFAAIHVVLRSRWLPAAAGAALVAVLAFRLGTGPFVAGFGAVTGRSLVAAMGIAVITTVCSAWRWTVVARRLDAVLPLKHAVAMYYRAQFLNTTLPGGVLGDVHRGMRQGRDTGDVARGLRAVVIERLAGQAVQVAIAAAVLLGIPSPLRSALTVVLAAVTSSLLLAAVVAVVALSLRRRNRRPGAACAWAQVAGASVVVVAGYTAMFVIAARVAGVQISTPQLLPPTMFVLLAMSAPTNIGGWGPREGVAAWVFALAGPGSAMGLTTATVYGVMTMVACAPGGVVLLVGWLRQPKTPRRWPGSAPQPAWATVAADPKGGMGG